MNAPTNSKATGPLTVITGASSGIGQHLAIALMSRGHRVIGVARRKERLDAIAQAHPAFIPLELDLLDAPSRESLAPRVVEAHGVPDYLILNAGLAHYGKLEKITGPQVAEQVGLNLLAVIQGAQAFLPAFLARGSGRILIVSSVLGVGVIPYASTYCATKFGVNGFVRGLRLDLRGSGVSVSALCPAGVVTEFRKVATGTADPKAMGQEPVERVVAGMVRQLDKNAAIIYPTFRAHFMGLLMSLFPRLMDWSLSKSRGQYGDLLPPERT